jgi:hypothetical protein
MIFGLVNASARQMTSGCFARSRPSAHSQKGSGFVCGLSTRKIFTPRAIQNSNTLSSSAHRSGQSADSKSNG